MTPRTRWQGWTMKWIMHWAVDVVMVLCALGMAAAMLMVAKGLFG